VVSRFSVRGKAPGSPGGVGQVGGGGKQLVRNDHGGEGRRLAVTPAAEPL